jgi:hypothetical protein
VAVPFLPRILLRLIRETKVAFGEADLRTIQL